MNFYQALDIAALKEQSLNTTTNMLQVTKLYNTLILYRNRKMKFIIKKESQQKIDSTKERDMLSKLKESSTSAINKFNFQEKKCLISMLEEEQKRINTLPANLYDYREDFVMVEINKFVKKTIANTLPNNNLEK